MMFPAEGVMFLKDLCKNNNKIWFQKNKKPYECTVKEPAKRLASLIAHDLEAELRVPIQHKVFRINRDLRFSKDKTPYNTHIRFSFWSRGNTTPKEMPAFHISIEPEYWIAGAGCLQMCPVMLSKFRTALKDTEKVRSLNNLITTAQKAGAYLDDPELKRVPVGVRVDHPEAVHFRRKSLIAWCRSPYAAHDLHSHEIQKITSQITPVYRWLINLQ